MAYTYTGQAALNAVQDLDGNDYATGVIDQALFANGSGTIVYLAAGHRSAAPYNTVQATYGDQDGELPYLDLTIDYSDSFLWNTWRISGASSSTKSSSDATSVGRYGQRANTRTFLFDVSGADGTNVLAALIAKYANPYQRTTMIQPNMGDPETARATLALDLMARIRVLRTPPGGGARWDQTLFVQRIDLSQQPGQPIACTLGVSPL